MFTHAIEVATGFTNPYVALRRRACGDVLSSLGAFIVVNSDGWIVTSAHIIEEILSQERIRETATEEDSDPQRVVAHSEIWAVPGFMARPARMVEAHVKRVADLGLCRIEPFTGEGISEYPVFRDAVTAPISQGMSVCRLGFPFFDVAASFSEERNQFSLDQGAFPIPRFALDGVVARFNRRVSDDGQASAIYIETSTPGLRGQSGGPLLDTNGRVCGVQSHTAHLDLGFDAQFSVGSQVVTERQFLNVGAATHVDEVRELMDSVDVKYRLG